MIYVCFHYTLENGVHYLFNNLFNVAQTMELVIYSYLYGKSFNGADWKLIFFHHFLINRFHFRELPNGVHVLRLDISYIFFFFFTNEPQDQCKLHMRRKDSNLRNLTQPLVLTTRPKPHWSHFHFCWHYYMFFISHVRAS